MGHDRWPARPGLLAAAAAAAVLGLVALAVILDGAAPSPVPSTSSAGVAGSVEETEEKETSPGRWPRRLPVAGARGWWAVLYEDGSSFLEGPDGQRKQLTEPGPVPQPAAGAGGNGQGWSGKGPAGPARTPGRLIVCDDGVVDVPVDAVITFIGRDRVVTLDPHDGSSTIYHTDGRVERRGRAERRPRWSSSGQP
jgi:hypothetical protein